MWIISVDKIMCVCRVSDEDHRNAQQGLGPLHAAGNGSIVWQCCGLLYVSMYVCMSVLHSMYVSFYV